MADIIGTIQVEITGHWDGFDSQRGEDTEEAPADYSKCECGHIDTQHNRATGQCRFCDCPLFSVTRSPN